MIKDKINSIKIRYKLKDYEKLKREAEKLGLSPNEYQKVISKKAKVEIKVENE